MVCLKPIDGELLREVASTHKRIITLEDGSTTGGLGAAVTRFLTENGFGTIPVVRLGVGDKWVHQGTVEQLKKLCGYGVADIVAQVTRPLQ